MFYNNNYINQRFDKLVWISGDCEEKCTDVTEKGMKVTTEWCVDDCMKGILNSSLSQLF